MRDGAIFDEGQEPGFISEAKALETYKKKRDFEETSEPADGVSKKNTHQFVIQRHHAHRAGHHFDLRLQNDEGTMSSWSIPKHHLPKSKEKLLAVKTEDHPVSYNKFEGEIPKGEYGAGTVKIHDHGSYEEISWTKDKIEFKLNGKKEHGTYTLIHTDSNRWLLIKS